MSQQEVMGIVAWVSGFVVFSLAVFHFSLFYVFKNRFHLWLSLGWLINILYIFLEVQTKRGLPPLLPSLFSTASLLPFALAERFLSRRTGWRTSSALLIGYLLSLTFLAIAWPEQNFLEGTLGVALFSMTVLVALARAISRVELDDFELLVRGDSADLFRPSRYEAKGPLVDRYVDELQASAESGAAAGKRIMAGAFFCFGLLQLAYPFRASIEAYSELLWIAPFVVGMSLKLLTAVGNAVMLRASATMVEAKVRRGSLAEELSKITSAVEHDMRAPLRDIRLIAKHLKQKYHHDPLIQRKAGELDQEVSRIKAVTDLILSIRESPDDYRRRTDKCNLAQVLGKAVSTAKMLHAGRDVLVKTDFPAQSILVFGYNERLTQVFTNLINNAVESQLAKPAGPIVVDVRLRLMKNEEKACVEVDDYGVGIDPQKIRFVKEAYYSTKETSSNPNRGLGLFIADRIVRLHGGRIELASEPGKGTTVKVLLPSPRALRRREREQRTGVQ